MINFFGENPTPVNGLMQVATEGPKPNGERKLVRKYVTSQLPGGKSSLLDVSKEVAKRYNIDPNMLASSSLVEGVNLMFNPKNKFVDGALEHVSGAYTDATERNIFDQTKYPVDAFYYAGLDNFGDIADRLKSKGYIDNDFDYALYPAWNESVERSIKKYVKDKSLIDAAYEGVGEDKFKAIDKINEILARNGVKPNQTVAFRTPEDMITAKGAWLRDMADQVDEVAAKKKVKLSPEERNYIIMSGYNGGFGTAKSLIDDIAAGNRSVTKTGGKNKAAHKNVSKRMEYMNYLSDMYSNPFPQRSSLANAVKK